MSDNVATTHRIPAVVGDCAIVCPLNAQFLSVTDPYALDEPIVTMLGDPDAPLAVRSFVLTVVDALVTNDDLIALGTVMLSTGALQLVEKRPVVPAYGTAIAFAPAAFQNNAFQVLAA